MTTRGEVWSGTTAWPRLAQNPLREFLHTEVGGAAVLLAATVTALVWVTWTPLPLLVSTLAFDGTRLIDTLSRAVRAAGARARADGAVGDRQRLRCLPGG